MQELFSRMRVRNLFHLLLDKDNTPTGFHWLHAKTFPYANMQVPDTGILSWQWQVYVTHQWHLAKLWVKSGEW